MAKHIERVRALFEKSPVVDFRSIARITGTAYAKLLVANMKGEIHRITKGCYSKRDDPSMAVFCLAPAYFGLQSALSFHGLWEQETIPVIITSRTVRTGMREIRGTNVLVRRSRHIFGYEYSQEGDSYFPYSDIEKTFIDMVVFGETIHTDVMHRFRKRIRPARLRRYLREYPRAVAAQVNEQLEEG